MENKYLVNCKWNHEIKLNLVVCFTQDSKRMDSQEDREGVEKGVQTKRSSQEDELE